MHRAWQAMNKNELWLRDQYRRRWAKAIAERDRDAFDRWHEKYEALHEHVLRREMATQRKVDKMDAHCAT
jgi:putative hemolysin